MLPFLATISTEAGDLAVTWTTTPWKKTFTKIQTMHTLHWKQPSELVGSSLYKFELALFLFFSPPGRAVFLALWDLKGGKKKVFQQLLSLPENYY